MAAQNPYLGAEQTRMFEPKRQDVLPIAAKMELQSMTDMFGRMSQSCFKKCVGQYKDGELHVGEMACIDRCVLKYMHTHTLVGQYLNAMQQQSMEQMQAQQQ